jgi:DNA-binding IclR family transcriptional regulator
MGKDDDTTGKQVIARAAGILKALEGQAEGLTIAAITRASGLPRTTALRIVVALQAQQMVVSVDGRVRLGPAITRLAGSTFLDVTAIARPHVEALARGTRETVNLSVLRGNHAVLVDQVASDHELRVVTPVGSALPLYCTAHGKALLADMSDGEVSDRLGDAWERRTANTVAGMAQLLAQLRGIRRGGVAYDAGENIVGVNGIGITLRTTTAERYALSIVMPQVRFEAGAADLVARIREAAEAISACF